MRTIRTVIKVIFSSHFPKAKLNQMIWYIRAIDKQFNYTYKLSWSYLITNKIKSLPVHSAIVMYSLFSFCGAIPMLKWTSKAKEWPKILCGTPQFKKMKVMDAEDYLMRELRITPTTSKRLRLVICHKWKGWKEVPPDCTVGEVIMMAKYQTAVDWEKGEYQTNYASDKAKLKRILQCHRMACLKEKWKPDPSTNLMAQSWRMSYIVGEPRRCYYNVKIIFQDGTRYAVRMASNQTIGMLEKEILSSNGKDWKQLWGLERKDTIEMLASSLVFEGEKTIVLTM